MIAERDEGFRADFRRIKSTSSDFFDLLSRSCKTNQRDRFNPVEKKHKQTPRISSALEAPHPIAALLSPPILITFAGFLGGLQMIPSGTKHVVGMVVVGGVYCFCRKAPLSISGTNSQQSRVPTAINPAQLFHETLQPTSPSGKNVRGHDFDRSDRRASNVRNPIRIKQCRCFTSLQGMQSSCTTAPAPRETPRKELKVVR